MEQPHVRLKMFALSLGVVLTSAACSELTSATGLGTTAAHAPPPPAAKPSSDAGAKTASASGVYSVTFGVKSSSRLGAVQFDARGPSGDWQGSGDKVACASLSSGAMHACNDKGGGVLSCGFIDTKGIAGGAELVRCDFASKSAVSAGDFSVRVIDASNTATKPVSANVVVTRVAAR